MLVNRTGLPDFKYAVTLGEDERVISDHCDGKSRQVPVACGSGDIPVQRGKVGRALRLQCLAGKRSGKRRDDKCRTS